LHGRYVIKIIRDILIKLLYRDLSYHFKINFLKVIFRKFYSRFKIVYVGDRSKTILKDEFGMKKLSSSKKKTLGRILPNIIYQFEES
jgi:hypothetical protein